VDDLIKNFVVVYWAQRGTGKSYYSDIPLETMNLNQFYSDSNELVDYLREKFSQEKIHILGQSWGSVLALQLVVIFPEKFHAYFAVSQIPHWTECEKDAYKWLVEDAKRKNKKKAILELEGNGIPPYQNMKEWESFRKWLFIFGGYSYKTKKVKPPTMMGFMKNLLSSPD
jgi:pimeloyl-ACP methyl ester carboxylesterase